MIGTVVAHFALKLLFFNSNYSRIMVLCSGHLATERPLKTKNNPLNIIVNKFCTGYVRDLKASQ